MKRNGRSGYTLLELALVLAIIAVLAAILFPIWEKAKDEKQRRSCQSNLKQLGLAFLMYQQDYSERFPPIAINDVTSSKAPFEQPFGWADAIYPYSKNLQLLQCPSEGRAANFDATQNGFSDYWFNKNVDGLPLNTMGLTATTFLLGDYRKIAGKQVVMNARFTLSAMPRNWLDEDFSAMRRHISNNYLFADGHVAGYRTGWTDMTVH